MTLDEIMTAALKHANGQDPVDLAQRMKDFLDGKLSSTTTLQLPAPDAKTIQNKPTIENKPKEDRPIKTGKKKRKSPTYPKVRPPNHCKPWQDEELVKAADLVKDARKRRDLEKIARQLGRTLKEFLEALYKGVIPVDPAQLHKRAFPNWDKVPYPKAPE